MTSLIFYRETIEQLLAYRKMVLADICHLVNISDNEVEIENFSQLFAISQHTSIPPSEYLAAYHKQNTVHNVEVTITRKDSQYTRIKGNKRHGGYHYRHVLITPLDPYLLVLRTTLLSGKQQARPNGGHRVKELVYVLSGRVGIVWKNLNGADQHSELDCGDSVYIDSWVPHAFYAIKPGSEILAMDYVNSEANWF